MTNLVGLNFAYLESFSNVYKQTNLDLKHLIADIPLSWPRICPAITSLQIGNGSHDPSSYFVY